MGAIRKLHRKDGSVSWEIDYLEPIGKVDEEGKVIKTRVRKSFKKKKNAEAELGKRVSLIAEDRLLDVKKKYEDTWGQLIDIYENDKSITDRTRYKSFKKYELPKIREYFGNNTPLVNITYADLMDHRNELMKEPTRNGGERKKSTINGVMVLLTQLFDYAKKRDMIKYSPFSENGTLLFKIPRKKKHRYLIEDEIERLLIACNGYLKDIIKVTLLSGMRRQEVLGLRWDETEDGFINLPGWRTKSGEDRGVPITDDLKDVLDEIKSRNDSEYVFPGKDGEPFKQVTRSYQTALEDAEIEDADFHTLRHTYATHFIRRGGSVPVLQEILGHEDINTTMIYVTLDDPYRVSEAKKMDGFLPQDVKLLPDKDPDKE
jgi:integrase